MPASVPPFPQLDEVARRGEAALDYMRREIGPAADDMALNLFRAFEAVGWDSSKLQGHPLLQRLLEKVMDGLPLPAPPAPPSRPEGS